MKMKAKTLIVVSAVLAVMVAFAVRATRQARDAREALTALAPQPDRLRKKADQMNARLQTAREALRILDSTSAGAAAESPTGSQAKGAVAGKSASGSAAAPAQRPNPLTLVANDPAKMAEYSRNFRAGLDLRWGGMFKAIGMSPVQIEKFKDVELWLQESRVDLQAAIAAQGLDSNSVEAQKLWTDYNNLRTTKKVEALGDLADRYFEYFGTQSVRNYSQELAWTGIFTGESISSAQVERTADVLIANTKRMLTGPGAKWVDLPTLDWTAASQQLKGVLSPAQIETLGRFVEKDKAQARVNQQTRRLTAQFNARVPRP